MVQVAFEEKMKVAPQRIFAYPKPIRLMGIL